MILVQGIDAIEIERFKHWYKYPKTKLSKIFSLKEIDYCLQNQIKSAERFAARFAAKEALYKAACSLGLTYMSFFYFCKIISVEKTEYNNPVIKITTDNIEITDMLDSVNISLSMTHTKTLAIASVIIYK